MHHVRLRPLREDEWSGWRSKAIEEYAGDVVRNRALPVERARLQAAKELDSSLPDGVRTADHHILVAEEIDSGERVGYLWFGPRTRAPDAAVAWLWDIYVEEPLRGRGFGRTLMHLLENEVRAAGMSRIELNVFADNERAHRLYGSLGFTEMARQMAKQLDP